MNKNAIEAIYYVLKRTSFLFPSQKITKIVDIFKKSCFFLLIRKSFVGKFLRVLHVRNQIWILTLCKKQNPNPKGVYCVIYRHAPASKTLPPPFCEVLDQTIRIVNFLKEGPPNC